MPDANASYATGLVIALPQPLLAHADAAIAADSYLAELAPSSQTTQRSALNVLARLVGVQAHPSTLADGKKIDVRYRAVPWHRLGPAETAALHGRLRLPLDDDDDDPPSPAYANRLLTTLRGVLTACWRLELIDRERLARTTDWKPIQGERLPPGRMISAGEQVALLTACAQDTTLAGARDQALLALLFGAGLRRAEAVSLLPHQLVLGEQPHVTVLGKRNKQRRVPLPEGTAQTLRDYLALRARHLALVDLDPEQTALFSRLRRGGWPVGQPLTPGAVRTILLDRASAAHLVEPIAPHDLRRTYVSTLLDEGIDQHTVQLLAGHASGTTTAKYDRRGERAMRQAVTRLHVPYLRRG